MEARLTDGRHRYERGGSTGRQGSTGRSSDQAEGGQVGIPISTHALHGLIDGGRGRRWIVGWMQQGLLVFARDPPSESSGPIGKGVRGQIDSAGRDRRGGRTHQW